MSWWLAIALGATKAGASGFAVRSMRASLPAVESERPLVLGRGWLELGLEAEAKRVAAVWSDLGERRALEDELRWFATAESVHIRYGIARHADVWARVPVRTVTAGPPGEEDVAVGLGDPEMGGRFEWFRRSAPTTSVVSELSIQVPAGREVTTLEVQGPGFVGGAPLSTGSPEGALALSAKQQIGALGLVGSLGYRYRFAGVPRYRLTDRVDVAGTRLRPPSEVQSSLAASVDAGPFVLSVAVEYRRRLKAALIYQDEWALTPLAGTDGWSLAWEPGLTINVSRGFELAGRANLPLRGEDADFFPFEDVSPTPGVTWAASVTVRY